MTKTHALKLILLSIGIIRMMYLLEVFCNTHHLFADCRIYFALVLLFCWGFFCSSLRIPETLCLRFENSFLAKGAGLPLKCIPVDLLFGMLLPVFAPTASKGLKSCSYIQSYLFMSQINELALHSCLRNLATKSPHLLIQTSVKKAAGISKRFL